MQPSSAPYPLTFSSGGASGDGPLAAVRQLAARDPALPRALRARHGGGRLRVHRVVCHPLHGEDARGPGPPDLDVHPVPDAGDDVLRSYLREQYPPFSFDTTDADPGDDPPVRVDVVPALTDRNRVTVFFRGLTGHPQRRGARPHRHRGEPSPSSSPPSRCCSPAAGPRACGRSCSATSGGASDCPATPSCSPTTTRPSRSTEPRPPGRPGGRRAPPARAGRAARRAARSTSRTAGP